MQELSTHCADIQFPTFLLLHFQLLKIQLDRIDTNFIFGWSGAGEHEEFSSSGKVLRSAMYGVTNTGTKRSFVKDNVPAINPPPTPPPICTVPVLSHLSIDSFFLKKLQLREDIHRKTSLNGHCLDRSYPPTQCSLGQGRDDIRNIRDTLKMNFMSTVCAHLFQNFSIF